MNNVLMYLLKTQKNFKTIEYDHNFVCFFFSPDLNKVQFQIAVCVNKQFLSNKSKLLFIIEIQKSVVLKVDIANPD